MLARKFIFELWDNNEQETKTEHWLEQNIDWNKVMKHYFSQF